MKLLAALKQGVITLCLPSRFSFTPSTTRPMLQKSEPRNENGDQQKEPTLSRRWYDSMLRRGFAGLAVFCGILVLFATPAFTQGPPPGVTPVVMPPCSSGGGPGGQYGTSADLSTTSNAVVADPHWAVSAVSALPPPHPAVFPAYHLLSTQIPGAWNPASNWLQPNAAPLPDGNASVGYFTYRIHFGIPACALATVALKGEYWADNSVTTFDVNGVPLGPLCLTNTCFQASHGTNFNFTIPAGILHPLPAYNTLTIVVYNSGGYTGLEFNATLTSTCSGANGTTQCGNLKLCKVAGPGVASGTPFTFNYTSVPASGTASIPAGPAPGGFCKLSTSVPDGTLVNLTEVLPAGDIVSNIAAEPPGDLVASNLGAGTASVRVGPGVTEVTYTDENQKEETGYLEICKQYNGSSTTAPPPSATFNITGASSGPVVVPVGACSPALEVPAGTVTITEVPIAGSVMSSCSTIPASDQVSCVPGAWTDTVTVAPGNIPNQTIAFITNSPSSTGGGGTTGFTLNTSVSTLTVDQGGTATATITVNPSASFDGSVTLATSALPSGVAATFDTNPTTGTSAITFTAGTTAVPGTSTITITGTSGTVTASTTITLTVASTATGTSLLELPQVSSLDFPLLSL
jgi:hypothetical protein